MIYFREASCGVSTGVRNAAWLGSAWRIIPLVSNTVALVCSMPWFCFGSAQLLHAPAVAVRRAITHGWLTFAPRSVVWPTSAPGLPLNICAQAWHICLGTAVRCSLVLHRDERCLPLRRRRAAVRVHCRVQLPDHANHGVRLASIVDGR